MVAEFYESNVTWQQVSIKWGDLQKKRTEEKQKTPDWRILWLFWAKHIKCADKRLYSECLFLCPLHTHAPKTCPLWKNLQFGDAFFVSELKPI